MVQGNVSRTALWLQLVLGSVVFLNESQIPSATKELCFRFWKLEGTLSAQALGALIVNQVLHDVRGKLFHSCQHVIESGLSYSAVHVHVPCTPAAGHVATSFGAFESDFRARVFPCTGRRQLQDFRKYFALAFVACW